MHEVGIASSILEKVLAETRSRGGGRVLNVRIRVGQLNHVMPDSLQFAWETLRRGTAAEKAVLQIEKEPARLRCKSCGWEGEVDPGSFDCGKCGGREVELLGGSDLVLESFSLEQD
jgi:hydrogenase nickel incorporation protein HypA/HybF